MKRLIYALIPLILTILSFLILWQTFSNPHSDKYNGEEIYPFSKGNAQAEIRENISSQLEYFANGYEKRDLENLDKFCKRLISKENILILGTMPTEIYSGYESASELIRTDWLYWGDVSFLMDFANISVKDSVAWISTIGYVEFDMSRFLVLPLRFSGLMVNEDSIWKFQQMQFQFDLDNMKILITIILLLLISIALFIHFVVILTKTVLKRKIKDL